MDDIKKLIIEIAKMSHYSKEGHIPSSLSILDILFVYYKNRNNSRMILSKGHASLGLYATLKHFGIIEFEDDEFCKFNSILGGHPSDKISGVEASTGSLGHGLPIGIGMALGNKILNKDENIYVIIGDGEINEGTMWESILLASHHKLDNIYCIMDFNRSGDRALKIDDISKKLKSFNWDVLDIDGHDHSQILRSLNLKSNGPKFIIANTIKGKGIDFMENNPEWHHKFPNESELNKIILQNS